MWVIIILLLYIKMSQTNYYQINRNVFLNRAKKCYKNDKERLRDNAWNNYKELSEEERNIYIERIYVYRKKKYREAKKS